MKLALHRSITFWSGILVITFICWAWRDSIEKRSVAAFSQFRLGQGYGGFFVERSGGPTGVLAVPNFTVIREQIVYHPIIRKTVVTKPVFSRGEGLSEDEDFIQKRRFPEKIRSFGEFIELVMPHQPMGDWFLFIPHWLALISIALPWSALLLWRARSRKRAAFPPLLDIEV